MKKFLFLLAATASLFLYSCSEKELAKPAVTATASASQSQPLVAAVRTTPAPGNYNVSLYVNDGDTSTAGFAGYVFTFKANGTLIAKVGKATYNGKWESKNNGTELKLDIDGTPILHQINKSWNVVALTNTLINLNDPEHGDAGRDVLNFSRI